MDKQMIKKLKVVLKDKLLNEIKDEHIIKSLKNKNKSQIIEYILENNLISEKRISELYHLYKDSSNVVIYILESTIKDIDYDTISEEKIEKAVYEINIQNVDDSTTNYKLENFFSNDDELLVELTYNKFVSVIYGGTPIITGYNQGDILDIKVLKDISIYHYKKYNNFVVKCNDWSAVKSVRSLIETIFSCSIYNPTFDKDLIHKLTINPDGDNHIIKASFLNYSNDSTQPKLLSISDESLVNIDIYNRLEDDFNYKKTYNCFRVEINSKPRFVGISNVKGKMWIPSILHKDELSNYARAILERINISLNKLLNNPNKYLTYFNGYRFDKNNMINDIFHNISNIICGDSNVRFTNIMLYNILRYGKKYFHVSLQPLYCEVHDTYKQIMCESDLNHAIQLVTDNTKINQGKILVKCKECSYRTELLEYIKLFKLECNCDIELHNYSDILTIVPYKKTVDIINKFLNDINYEEKKTSFFRISNGQLEKKSYQTQKKESVGLSYFKPLRGVLTHPIDNTLCKELKNIYERCLKANPKKEFCIECYHECKDGTSLVDIDIDDDKLRKNNKTRICLMRVFGFVIGLECDGIHHGYEKADIIFNYDVNNEVIIKHTDKKNQGMKRVGIHVKSPNMNDPKDCINPKINSAIGQIITSHFKKVFDIIGFAIPNNLNTEITDELEFICNGLDIELFIIDKEDWLRIYSYYREQKSFDDI